MNPQLIDGEVLALEDDEKKRKKPLFLLLIFAILAAAVGVGTFASFSASTTNDDNTFQTGKMVLRNTGPATTCFSGYSGPGIGSPGSVDTNDNPTCDELFTNSLLIPGTPAFARLTVENMSVNVPNATLGFWPSACLGSTVGGVPSPAQAGSRDICLDLQFYVANVNGAGVFQSCAFPASAGTDQALCKLGAPLNTLGTNGAGSTGLGALDAGVIRNLEVGVLLPNLPFDGQGNGGNNNQQYRTAAFDLNWRIQSL